MEYKFLADFGILQFMQTSLCHQLRTYDLVTLHPRSTIWWQQILAICFGILVFKKCIFTLYSVMTCRNVELITAIEYNHVISSKSFTVFGARSYASAAYVVMRCLSVHLSVCVSFTFVDHVKTNKRIFKFFSPLGSHVILVFSCQTAQQYSRFRREPP